MEEKIYKVDVLHVRNKFVEWIKNRGGVTVWENIDPSKYYSGELFTPAITVDGNPYPQPKLSHKFAETVTDIKRFRFVKLLVFVKRIRIAMKRSRNGPTLTDASRKRLKKELDEVGANSRYHFEGNNAVIEKAVWK